MQKSNMFKDIISDAIQKIEFILVGTPVGTPTSDEFYFTANTKEGVMEEAMNELRKTLDLVFSEEFYVTPNKGVLEEVMNELRTMLDFLRGKESGERSRLTYLLADYADIVQLIIKRTVDIGKQNIKNDMSMALHLLMKTRKRVMEFGNGEPQSVGEELGVVVGLEKDVQQLVGRAILNEEPKLLSVCIKGMLGMGKTTLARQVYNHPSIVEKFKHRAWVNMSCDTSVHEVLVELIRQLAELDAPKEMDNLSLRRMLCQNMEGEPCFVVLDNMPKELYYDLIFMEDQLKGGSRILITSRHQFFGDVFNTHKMKSLDSEKSWRLFSKTFDKYTGVENIFSNDMKKKGKEMLEKCWGLPISIINVGKQKAKQRNSGIEWEQLFDSVDLSESLKLLEPMYRGLDEELKPCFLHMFFFKENAIMRPEKLEQIWAINGIDPVRSLPIPVSAEERYVSQPCINELVGESVIEVVHDFPFGLEVKRCRMNPLLHMLSIKIAEEELGLEILRNNANDRFSHNPRHRVIHCGREKFNHFQNQDKNLVSLIFHGGGRYLDDASMSYWKSFELLSILDMEDFGVKCLSETIGTLTGLRYLGLRNNYIQEIPHSFGGLKKLEVFDIALNFMVEVPDIINEMGSLRHLYMSDVICCEPLNVDALHNLETLTYISIYDLMHEVSRLEKMTSLRKLGVEEVDENSDVSRLFASLAKLSKYECLILRGFRFKIMPCLDKIGVLDKLKKLRLDGRLTRLPSAAELGLTRLRTAMECLKSLTYLVLVNTCLEEDPMPVLASIWHLRAIKLRNAYTGRQMAIGTNYLSRLEVLRINELWNLRDIQVRDTGLWRLQELEIKNCPLMETLPDNNELLPCLRKLKMVTTKDIATKIRKLDFISKLVEVDISP
ncbi:disease resistance RPP8-like protein 3 [Salvia hispanica]|uniref:disease resistance RPP8-like protein 3 n=1 Tax=Salvia hispanica TaxID=49212 RepID=UPI002009C9FA|nr:disease resistance RPP8-like protein 3 [Salvia hispanica]XP_047946679.1 disease resistance RPP8-like protein 3 [Salvia hispanica]XP_047946680.1 disease resistance RPP8-like protein 3 [Salvia hispanica]